VDWRFEHVAEPNRVGHAGPARRQGNNLRWLQATGYAPNLIYLDSAHEIDETYYELTLYWQIVEPGGILMGDDLGWEAVQKDVTRFAREYGLELKMFGVFYNWYIIKPLDYVPPVIT